MARLDRREALAGLGIYAWTVAWILAFRFGDLPPGNDSGQYLVLAKGIATGRPFADLSSPDPQAGGLLGPALFPFLLSLYWRFPAPDLGALKLAVALAMGAAPAAAFLWMRKHLDFIPALLAALAFGCSYMLIVQGNSVMTECVFTPLFYLALWASAKGSESGANRWAAAAMIAWAAVARTRVIGWIFFFGFAAAAIRGRKGRWLIPGLVLAAAWLAWERILARDARPTRYTDGLFTDIFPVLTRPWEGLMALARNLGGNLYDFSTAIAGHILAPIWYEAFAMSAAKRAGCLALFLWTAWGLWLTWKSRPALRPWIAMMLLAQIPTFVIFHSHDAFRYLMPFFPFLALFWLAPWEALGRRLAAGRPWARHLPAASMALLLAAQAAGSWRHDFASEYIDFPDEFASVHDAILALPARPEVCLSGDAYYTWLKIGCPSFQFWGTRHPMPYMREHAMGKETWAICGPRNDYFCDGWASKGMAFGKPVLRTAHGWELRRVEAWPDSAAAAGD